MCSEREAAGAEREGARSPELAGGSKGARRQLCSQVAGALLRLWEGEALQAEETASAEHVA